MVIEYPSINHLDLTGQTYRILRERILQRQMKPGEKISVEEIAQGLGVSRTPVVNALKMLETDGLVAIIPRRGTFVTELTAREVAEMFEVRLLIELYAADHAFQSGNIKYFLDEMRNTLAHMQGAISEEDYVDYESFINSDRDMHTQLVRMVGNNRLIRIYSELNIHMQVTRAHYLNTVENALQAQKEHEAMVEAVTNNDVAGLKKALTEHIENVKSRILVLLEERGGRL